MVDIEKENNSTPEAPKIDASSDASATKPTQPAKDPQKASAPEMSKGEKTFNKLVYNWVGYWVNLAISMAATDLFLHGKGRPTYDGLLKNINSGLKAAQVEKVIGKTVMERATHVALGTVTLNSGGNLLLIPMKIMEDNKRPMVHWINKNIYKDPQLAPDGHAETPDEIYIVKEQPPQSWGNVLWRRMQAMGSTIVAGLLIDKIGRKTFDSPQVINGKTVTHIDGQERFTGTVVDGVSKVLEHVPGGKSFTSNPTVNRYMGYAALDTIYTKMTATVMHKTNGAGKARLPHEIGDDVDPPGIIATNEVVILPKGEKIVDSESPYSPADNKFAKYQKKSITPTEKHTDLIKTSDATPSMSP